MALYRVIYRISKGSGAYQQGELLAEDTFSPETLQALINRGALSRVAAPPLSEVAGWEVKARKFESAGIVTIEHLLETPVERIASIGKVSRATAQRWRDEMVVQLLPPPRDGCEGCRS